VYFNENWSMDLTCYNKINTAIDFSGN